MMKIMVCCLFLWAGFLHAAARVPVIVELFTSEGCSSCPPADRLLIQMQSQPLPNVEIIALEEHVDYWNNGGWRDPFSLEAFSLRQREYARQFGPDSIYTPQMVVNGRVQFVGSDGKRAQQEIKAAALEQRALVAVAPAGRSLDIEVTTQSSSEPADVWLIIAEDGLSTDVKAGENSGIRMPHASVVRSMSIVGRMKNDAPFRTKASLKLSRDWSRENLRAVVFVQERTTRKITGAASLSLSTLPRT